MKYFYQIIILVLIVSCQSKLDDKPKKEKKQNIALEILNFKSASISIYPSFDQSLHIEIDYEKREIKLNKSADVFVADSLSVNSFTIIDSSRYKKIQNFLPKGISETRKLSDLQFEKVNAFLHKFGNCTDEESEIGPDGTTMFVSLTSKDLKTNECRYWLGSGDQETFDLFILLEEIYDENSTLVDAVEMTSRSLFYRVLKVKSKNPLYVKLLRSPRECFEMSQIMDSLPKAKEIFVDMTNYRGQDLSCITVALRNKYKHIRWIVNEPFDKHQEHIINGK